ncbi:unnamed protein product, partial [marine sediment metagenome]
WVYNSMYADYKGLLFEKKLVKTGKTKIAFESTERLDRIMRSLKTSLKELVQVVNDYSDIKTTINVEVKSND